MEDLSWRFRRRWADARLGRVYPRVGCATIHPSKRFEPSLWLNPQPGWRTWLAPRSRASRDRTQGKISYPQDANFGKDRKWPGQGRFIFRLRWTGSSATPRDGTRSAASPKKSKITSKITIRKRIKSTIKIKIKGRTSCARPTNAGGLAPPLAPALALSPLSDLALHLALSLLCEPLANPPSED